MAEPRPVCPSCKRRGMRRDPLFDALEMRRGYSCVYCGHNEHDFHCAMCTKERTAGEVAGHKVPYHFWEVNHFASDRAPLVTLVWLGVDKHGVRGYQVHLTYTGREYLTWVLLADEMKVEDPRVLVNRRGRNAWERCPFGTQRIYDLKQAAMAAVDGAPRARHKEETRCATAASSTETTSR